MEMADDAAINDGLRERKKRATRQAIADAARALFLERGYDAVTVAEVAAAADVSEKTGFNHFATKEDLVFAHGGEQLSALIASVRDRPPGTSVLGPFRAAIMTLIDGIETGDVEEFLATPRMVRESKVLRTRLAIAWEQEGAALAPVIAEAAGVPEDDLVAAIVARTLAWTNRTVLRAAF